MKNKISLSSRMLSFIQTKIPKSFFQYLIEFKNIFTSPAFNSFCCIIVSIILCVGRHTIMGIISSAKYITKIKHFTNFHRFFSQAKWSLDQLCGALVIMVYRLFLKDFTEIIVFIDDTLHRRKGGHIWGTGLYYDPVLSTRQGKKKDHFSFGHSWVHLSIFIPFPWNKNKGLAVPVLFRLYRSPKTCPSRKYKTRPEFAVELIQQFRGYIPLNVKIIVVVDYEYACKTLIRNLPDNTELYGPLPMDAAIFSIDVQQKRRGRKRKRGERLPSPEQMAYNRSIPWTRKNLLLYSKRTPIRYKSIKALWPNSAGYKPIKVVVSQFKKGEQKLRAFFSTNANTPPEKIFKLFAIRWSVEVMHQEVKEHMKIEHIRNGWWRNRKGSGKNRRERKVYIKENKGDKAVLRTAPIYFIAYTLVAVWFLKNSRKQKRKNTGSSQKNYKHSSDSIPFSVMLFEARKEFIERGILSNPISKDALHELKSSLYALLKVA